jgi:hypothetical protein
VVVIKIEVNIARIAETVKSGMGPLGTNLKIEASERIARKTDQN